MKGKFNKTVGNRMKCFHLGNTEKVWRGVSRNQEPSQERRKTFTHCKKEYPSKYLRIDQNNLL